MQESEKKLPKEIMNEVASIAANVAIEKYKQELEARYNTIKDKRLGNAKLLVKKYKWLTEYNENAIYETAQLCKDGLDDVLAIMGVEKGEVHQVESIRHNVVLTRIIMEHVATMLSVYKARCEGSAKPEDQRRWRVLCDMYLSDDTVTPIDIARKERINERTVYKDIDDACEELSALFFGLDLSRMWR